MISKGNTHKNGVRLANYMTTGKKGERAELWQMCGFEATNIRDGFRDVQIMAGATKCEHPFFHVQVRNRDGETLTRPQWEHAADRIERMLGLANQPRAIAFHIDEKTGHEHMHVAWSRIDEDTLTAKRLPFFKERLKKISRELEMHFGLEVVTSQRPDKIKYAPTRAEHEQARRLGLNVHELRNAIRSCYERSDCGASFQAALEHEGMILAQGEKRDFIVIDREGGMHALGKRILDDPISKIRARLSDLSRDGLPTVEAARVFVLENGRQERKEAQREKPEPLWDRDRDDRTWQEAVVNAAIDKEKAERKYVQPEQRKERAGSRKEKTSRGRAETAASPAMKGMTARIDFMLTTLRNDPEQITTEARTFSAVLDGQGIGLARVTKEEADRSHRQAEFAKAVGNRAPRYREGEIVAVTEPPLEYRRKGEIVVPQRVHKLDPQAAEKFVAALDKGTQLKGIDATKAALDHRAQERSEHWNAIRMENATAIRSRAGSFAKDGIGKTVKIGGGAARSIGKTLDAAADAFASLIAPALTPRQIREGERAKDKREAEAADVIDFTRFTAELAQQRQQEQEREAARREDRGRER